jgi:beta-glucosidase
MIGAEARASGFNVMLAGGVNLMRDPRNGRNFEYAGEDPLLAGTMVGNAGQGHPVESRDRDDEALSRSTTRKPAATFSTRDIDDASNRMSDLLAIPLADGAVRSGSVMCSYNR